MLLLFLVMIMRVYQKLDVRQCACACVCVTVLAYHIGIWWQQIWKGQQHTRRRRRCRRAVGCRRRRRRKMSEYERYELCICICMYAWYINKPSHINIHAQARTRVRERVRARRRIVVVFVAFCFLTGAQGGDWRRCRCFFCASARIVFFLSFPTPLRLAYFIGALSHSVPLAVFMTAPLPTTFRRTHDEFDFSLGSDSDASSDCDSFMNCFFFSFLIVIFSYWLRCLLWQLLLLLLSSGFLHWVGFSCFRLRRISSWVFRLKLLKLG